MEVKKTEKVKETLLLTKSNGIEISKNIIIMRPSSLGAGRILRRTLSVCLSVCLSVRPVIERHVAPPSELQ